MISKKFKKSNKNIFHQIGFFLAYSNKYEIFRIRSWNELHYLSLNIFQTVIFRAKSVIDQKLRNFKGYMIWNLKRNRSTQFQENSQKVVLKNNFLS